MGRRKGNVAEREVAKLLEAWWRRFDPEARFERTPLSGGLQHAVEFDVVGDVMVRARGFPWSVEVKRRESAKADRFVAGKPTAIWGWWREAQDDAQSSGREPMLWFRRNRDPWRVVIRAGFAREMLSRVGHWRVTSVEPPAALGTGIPPTLYLGADFLTADPGWFARSSGAAATSG
jgi:hypothetical protein